MGGMGGKTRALRILNPFIDTVCCRHNNIRLGMQVSHHRLCLCTCPDEKIAQELAHSLVEARLAACVNILPAITSVYMWQGRIEQDGEVLLLIKTSEQRLPDLQAHIVARHPYELPEVIAVPITDGLTGYLQWLDDVMESQT